MNRRTITLTVTTSSDDTYTRVIDAVMQLLAQDLPAVAKSDAGFFATLAVRDDDNKPCTAELDDLAAQIAATTPTANIVPVDDDGVAFPNDVDL